MRQQTIQVSIAVGSVCAVLFLIAGGNAQDDQQTPVVNPQLPTVNSPNTGQIEEKTFRQILAEVRANEKKINQLFTSLPIGFPKQQIEHMARIDAVKKTNEELKGQLDSAALKAFQLDPKRDQLATQLVFSKLVKKLDVSASSSIYDPQGALEIAEMMLATDLDSEPVGPVKLEDVAWQGFLSSYALEDYSRADLMLKKIEDKGIQLQGKMREELVGTQEKWQRELMIRRLESNTDDLPRVKFETSEGDVVVELFENHAPQTVGNFVSLVEKNFYNELPFFLVQPSRFAQTGCPVGDGSGDPGYLIPCETEREQIRHHFTGTLSMANSGHDTGGSQFFITHQRNSRFDGKFTAFGRVIEGMDVVYRFNTVDGTKSVAPEDVEPVPSTILKATVIRKRDHPYAPTRVAKNPENSGDGTNTQQPQETIKNPNSGD